MDPEARFDEMWAKTMGKPRLFRNLNCLEQAAVKDLMKCMFVATAEMVLAYVKEHPEEMLTVIVPGGGMEEGGAAEAGKAGGG
jgi:hypothetical protein